MKHVFWILFFSIVFVWTTAKAETTSDFGPIEEAMCKVDRTTHEGWETFSFYNTSIAFLEMVNITQNFPLEKRLAFAQQWEPYLSSSFQPAIAEPLLTIALDIEHPFGSLVCHARAKQLDLFNKHGDILAVSNQVAWFLLTSSNEPEDHQLALKMLRARGDLDSASYDTLGYAYYRLGHYEDALQSYFTSYEYVNPEDPLAAVKRLGILYHIGEVFFAMDELKDCYMAWQKVAVELKAFAQQYDINLYSLTLTLDIDYAQLRKRIKALRVILKKEATTTEPTTP